MIRKHKKLLIVICIVVTCICAVFLFLQYQNRKSQTILNLTAEQKLSDFDTLCEILDISYPFWGEVEQAGIDREIVYNTYRTNIENTDTDIEFFKEIGYFLNEFDGFGHLSALDGYMYGIYMDTISESNRVLSAKEKQGIEPLRKVLENPVSQNTYHLLDQSHSGFRSIIGLKEEYESADTENTEHTTKTSELVTSIYDERTAYIKIDSFELTNYQKDKEILESFFEEITDIPNLIIDLRDNSGGSDLYWRDLIVKPNAKGNMTSERYFLFNKSEITDNYVSALEISESEIDELPELLLSQYKNCFTHYTTDTDIFEVAENPYSGTIWVLIDDTVYSSSENFVMFCKNTGFATLVGTPTNGDGGMADPLLVSLPNSGLIVRFSMFYGLNGDGSGNEANGTKPDIIISENEDALTKCLEQIDN